MFQSYISNMQIFQCVYLTHCSSIQRSKFTIFNSVWWNNLNLIIIKSDFYFSSLSSNELCAKCEEFSYLCCFFFSITSSSFVHPVHLSTCQEQMSNYTVTQKRNMCINHTLDNDNVHVFTQVKNTFSFNCIQL